MKNLLLIFLAFFLIITSFVGCNTIAGTTKGIVEDIRDIVPII